MVSEKLREKNDELKELFLQQGKKVRVEDNQIFVSDDNLNDVRIRIFEKMTDISKVDSNHYEIHYSVTYELSKSSFTQYQFLKEIEGYLDSVLVSKPCSH